MHWTRLLLATFIVPPLIALGLGQVLPLALSATAGLFLIAVAPGAPLNPVAAIAAYGLLLKEEGEPLHYPGGPAAPILEGVHADLIADAMAAEMRDRERKITHQALHDDDTGLPNRLALERVVEALADWPAGQIPA